ncbi:cysteine synthase CysM [Flammeovirga kamogawensis]|uniref:Cysteine synthase n=1 Tax=Flammeovirga kamogawensis TaxID=373891 RepID=A0ABX8GWT4_9BACT|nr:cysteine synthase CysM [Flammeovirga kamogawensis]MBB6461323.1 cysteine synthase B [Flammeovirga kamogawensis]QWG07879.1 cysteine synthase CysM [Flammeovirga kamogawensis]TRX69686.1 cysteine synthase CysM [Flammeovirga kamogawensis]
MSSVLSLVGNTPLVELKALSPNPNVTIYAKLEGQNPGGSVKDRAAYNMIKQAQERGDLKSGVKLIEATSGNTGIALAMISSLMGIEIELVMPDNATIERIKSMKAYGATVTLTPQKESMEGARDYALRKVEEGGYFMLNQFDNPDNYMAHYKTTGPEIWRDTDQKVTHFVSAMGTTGTIMGTSKFLKEQSEKITIVGTQPAEGAKIPGIRRWPKAYLPKIFDESRVDQKIDVSQENATNMTRLLAKEEGIFAGMSSGGSAYAAIETAKKIDSGVIVFIVCDRGDKYLSTSLF